MQKNGTGIDRQLSIDELGQRYCFKAVQFYHTNLNSVMQTAQWNDIASRAAHYVHTSYKLDKLSSSTQWLFTNSNATFPPPYIYYSLLQATMGPASMISGTSLQIPTLHNVKDFPHGNLTLHNLFYKLDFNFIATIKETLISIEYSMQNHIPEHYINRTSLEYFEEPKGRAQ